MDIKIFVTGGSGFVGQHLVRRLTGEGYAVLGLARSDRAAELIMAAGGDVVTGDLADLASGTAPPEWISVLAGCDAVIHAAARMEFWGPDAGFQRDNFAPAVALHEAAAAADVGRFVLVSAASVSTGSQRAAVVDEDTDNGRPNIAYSRVKLATEQALLSADTPTMDTVVLRPPFIWGPGMTTATEMADLARVGGWKWIDRGRHVMDFIHVGNLAAAADLALTRGRSGGIYYVTDATPMSIRDFMTSLLATQGVDVSRARSVPLAVAAPLAAMLDSGARLLRRPKPPTLTNWLVAFLGHDRTYDITAARRDLGYTPCVDLAQGLREMTSTHLG
ncbi:NAD-dependent epimerase/dehydratase family protein [Amycolatopsis sp. NPDC005232]|uniref:NAD-dependent epimerase/dehydratase family protein n=1 Tax=Amycolatopsis sp. NPDC005232 TaxID=3157027 RepID=UPI0033A9A0A2